MSRFTAARRIVVGATAVALAAVAFTAPSASATPARTHSSSIGTTTVTTAPGIATTLLRAGIAPLPVPPTHVGISFTHGLQVSYGFPITSSTADLSTGTGGVFHDGGIYFASRSAHLEVGKFVINLAIGKVIAREVNFAPGRVALLDLDLSNAHVSTGSHGETIVSGIVASLDRQAANALNATFGTALPADGSLVFGSAQVVLN